MGNTPSDLFLQARAFGARSENRQVCESAGSSGSENDHLNKSSCVIYLFIALDCSVFWMTVTQSVCSLAYIHFLLTKGNMHLMPFIKMNILFFKKKCQGSPPHLKDGQLNGNNEIIKSILCLCLKQTARYSML